MNDSRDWFPSGGEPDPMRSAQAGLKTALPRRFYKEAGLAERDGLFTLVLDGRPARTPGRQVLGVRSRPLAEALVREWADQGDEIDPTGMPVTRIVNSAIDGVAPRRIEVADDLARYAETDLVFYRAGEPRRLADAQEQAWAPILDWAGEVIGARFILAEGVMHVRQPARSTLAVRDLVRAQTAPECLAALHVMTTLTGSVLIALAHALGRIDADVAWDAAHVDERFQESVWGEDHEAMVRRQSRKAEFLAASRVFRLAAAADSAGP
ncbi:MAG: ATP12 family protein [Microvirga sp.]